MTAIAMGVHVLDVLVRPVEAIPEGQGGQLVEEIRMTAAGSAGGFALVLARLGATVRSAASSISPVTTGSSWRSHARWPYLPAHTLTASCKSCNWTPR